MERFKCLISFIRGFIFKKRREIKWALDRIKIRKATLPVNVISIEHDASFLILMPHSDDEWIGCSQILMHFPHITICNLDMQGGDSDEIHEKRYEESLSLSRRFGGKHITYKTDKTLLLADYLKNERPQYVLLPFFFDWHSEHIEVMNLLRGALNGVQQKCNIMMYQISVPFPSRFCNFCMPMSKKEQAMKWSIFNSTYKTQNFMPVKRFMANEIINGGYCNSYSAEVFSCCKSDEWLKMYDNMLLDDCERHELKNILNSISKIRQLVEDIAINRKEIL